MDKAAIAGFGASQLVVLVPILTSTLNVLVHGERDSALLLVGIGVTSVFIVGLALAGTISASVSVLVAALSLLVVANLVVTSSSGHDSVYESAYGVVSTTVDTIAAMERLLSFGAGYCAVSLLFPLAMGHASQPDPGMLSIVVESAMLTLLVLRAVNMCIASHIVLSGDRWHTETGALYTPLDGFTNVADVTDEYGTDAGTTGNSGSSEVPGVLFRQRRGSSFKDEQSSLLECPVCIEPMEASSSVASGDQLSQLQCRHAMHEECARRLESHNMFSCPLCRADCLERGNTAPSHARADTDRVADALRFNGDDEATEQIMYSEIHQNEERGT